MDRWRYEDARRAYTDGPRDDENEDDVFARQIKAAFAMWLADKGEVGKAERLVDEIAPARDVQPASPVPTGLQWVCATAPGSRELRLAQLLREKGLHNLDQQRTFLGCGRSTLGRALQGKHAAEEVTAPASWLWPDERLFTVASCGS